MMSWQRKESKVKVQNLWTKVHFIWILFLECVLGILVLACECFFFCNQCHIMHFHRILVKSDFRGQYFFVFNVFCCYVVFVFLMIILLLEVLQILTLNSRYLLCSKTLICYVHVLLNHKNTFIYIVHVPVILTVKQTIRNIDIGVDIILSKWESSENQSSLFSGETSSKGLLFGTVLTCNYAMS